MHIRLLPIVAALLVCGASSLHAQVLFVVNESNPGAVTITATANLLTTSASSDFYDGFDLESFYNTDASNFNVYSTSSSTLTTYDSSAFVYDSVYYDNASTNDNYNNPDLNLSSAESSPSDTESFTAGSPAFTGVATIDLTDYQADLSAAGGNVLAGNAYAGYTIIGTYIVAPEPSTYALLLGGFALLGFCLRRKAAFLS
jgi:hypothetical protein